MKWSRVPSPVIALVTAISVVASGCSFLLVSGPDSVSTPASGGPPRAYPRCTDSMTWPAVDGGLALLLAIGMFSAINQSDEEYAMGNPDRDPHDQRMESSIALGVLALTAGVSAFVGYGRVNRCATAREEFAKAYPQGQGLPTWGAPQPYGYPQPGYAPQGYPPQQGYPPAGAPQGYPQSSPAQPPQIPPGTEGGSCMQASICNQGLVCASGLCVRPPSPAPEPAPSTTP